MSTNLVWKNKALANAEELKLNVTDVEMAELYVAAKQGILTFDTIPYFDYSVLSAAGMTNDDIDKAHDVKYTIPDSLRDTVTALQIKAIIANYEEKNNYYRMLYGLPDTDDTLYIYNTKYTDISQTTPIHKLSLQDRLTLESYGYIDELVAANPTKKYLKYLGSKNIEPYLARTAEQYSILYMTNSTYDRLTSTFRDVYNNCRYTVIRVYYSDAFKKDNEFYEGYMGMCILFMTINVMLYKYLDADITRDFYDAESIRYIYESYNVPFYSSIPIEYHKKIVKGINRLIADKGSTKVFYDLFDIFNYGSMDVFEWYLLKIHKLDSNGNPIISKNTDGSYKYSDMYDLKFGKVRLYDNPPLELSDPSNHVDYNSIIKNDPYWVNDTELTNKLYQENFNYLETKYIGIQTVIEMMKIMYEAAYYFQMIFNNKSLLISTTVYISVLGQSYPIFAIVVYLAALTCKKYGYDANISSNLANVSKILGFNFKADLTTVRNSILQNKDLKNDTTLLTLISNMNVNSLDSINTTIGKIQNLRIYLSQAILNAKTKDEFYAYLNLEKTLMVSDLVADVYKKSNGTVASSFPDLLEDISPDLYTRYNTSTLDVKSEISSILSSLKQSTSNLKYIENSDNSDFSSAVGYLFKMLDFFKSAKCELTDYKIIYSLSSRFENWFKMLSDIKTYSESEKFQENFQYLDDLIFRIYLSQKYADKNISLLKIISIFVSMAAAIIVLSCIFCQSFSFISTFLSSKRFLIISEE
jgi:hypothetical protein